MVSVFFYGYTVPGRVQVRGVGVLPPVVRGPTSG